MAIEDIAGYSLRRGLGSGSVGAVWLVRDLGTGCHAVLKRLPSASVPSAEEFRRDLALVQGSHHPHLVALLEVRRTEREWLLFSDYVAAGTLAGLLHRRGPLSTGELVTLLSPLAQALGALHRRGLDHGHLGARDVMFAADGRPVLTDAGLRLLTAPAGTADPSRPGADLAALADLAMTAGADPQTFGPGLFEGDGEQIEQRILALATPEPIKLGFGDEARAVAPRRPKRPRAGRTTRSPRDGHRMPVGEQPAAADSVREPAAGPGPAKAPARPNRRAERARGTVSKPAGRARRAPRSRPTAYGVVAMIGLGGLAVLGIGLVVFGTFDGSGADGVAAEQQGQRPIAPTGPTTPTGPGASTTPTGPGASTTPTGPGASSRPGTLGSLGTLGTPTPGESSVSTPSDGDALRWLSTLQTLDVRRARAFAGPDLAGLDTIYVPGSPPWQSDRSLLGSYRERRLRVDGLRLSIEQVEVERPGDRTVVLRVVDRLVGGAVVDRNGRRTLLPAGRSAARRITLAGAGGTWRISAITTAEGH